MNETENPEHILHLALALRPEKRAAWLDRACAGNEKLRERVDALMAERRSIVSQQADSGATGQNADASTKDLPLPGEESPGATVGRYKLLEKIGEGGFGVVYVAQQQEAVKRRVALKIIKPGMDTRQVIGRFEAERQALAMMDHPNIAKVLDACATETGRPFFVMELVQGIKLTDYCDQHRLVTTDRLALFIKVCHAIQHAHQKGIIHRDIKPSNILVTLHDGVPIPKVIDFGIAKATHGVLTDKTVYTQFQQFVGTPAYMSPEQAEMSGLDVDTRSDIYSLGVLLYELLTGRTPFDQQVLMEAGLDGMRRMIREKEPVRPSTRISSLDQNDRTATAERRQVEVPGLVRQLRGDLDWIVMKCLEKDRTRRYETANGLAMDLERYLRNEPVAARPPSKLYRFSKTVRRNKLAFASAAAVIMAVVAGAILSGWQAVRASHAKRQAETINRFLTEGILYQATPDENDREKRVTMEEALGRAVLMLAQDAEIARDPEVEAALRLAIGTTYFKLGVLAEARQHLHRAVTLRQAAFGPQARQTLEAQKELVTALTFGEAHFDLKIERLSFDTWKGLQGLLNARSSRADLKLQRCTLDSMASYCWVLAIRGELAKALALKRENTAAYDQVFGPDDRDSINELGNLAYLLRMHGENAEAEPIFREVLKRFSRAKLADTADALTTAMNLSEVLYFRGKSRDAESVLVEANPRALRVLGEEHPITLGIQSRLARVLSDLEKFAEAEDLAAKTLATRQRLDARHVNTGYSMVILARVLVAKNGLDKASLDRAESLLEDAREIFRAGFKEKRPDVMAQTENVLGAIQLARGNNHEAEILLLPFANQFLVPTAEISPNERRVALGHIIKLYQALNKADEQAKWQNKLDTLSEGLTKSSKP